MIESRAVSTTQLTVTRRPAPPQLWIGLALLTAMWTISWLRVVPLSDHYFFPLWLGYILVVDGLVLRRTGTSPLSRAGWRIAWLFVTSVPLWWIFELFNEAVENWSYHTRVDYGPLGYALLASIAFSTVIPAVLTTSELVRSFGWNPLSRLPGMKQTRARLIGLHLLGWAMLAAIVVWPGYAFPLVWLSMIFLLDPLLTWIGGRSLGWFVSRGDWSPLFNLALATLICGWCWEMWNFYSLPKWTYDVPHVEWLHIWEMPLLGYGGYIPFGLEVWTIFAFCSTLARFPIALWPRVSASDLSRAPTPTRADDQLPQHRVDPESPNYASRILTTTKPR
jgi:hypothetical protein